MAHHGGKCFGTCPCKGMIVSLTVRELHIMKEVAKGLSSKDIASDLGLSPATIECHRYNLTKKLGLENRVKVMLFCLKNGLIQVTDLPESAVKCAGGESESETVEMAEDA